MPDSTPVTAKPVQTAPGADIDGNIARIRAFFRQSGWSLNRMAREAGVAWSTIQGLPDNPAWNPTADTLRKLEAVVPSHFDPARPAATPTLGAGGPEDRVAGVNLSDKASGRVRKAGEAAPDTYDSGEAA